MDDNKAKIHVETVICNGVEFEPELGNGNGLLWHLLTPMSFISALALGENLLRKNEANAKVTEQQQQVDLTTLVFHNAEEFREYITGLI